jgi:hypothetical protein
MPNRATTKRWVVLLLILFHSGIGTLIGVSVAEHLHHSGEGWFGPVIMGIFFGVLGTLFVLFLVSNLPREIAKVFYLRSNKTKICGVLPAWIILGALMLFGLGGSMLGFAGIVAQSRVLLAAGALAVAIVFVILGLLILFGLCRLVWKKSLSLWRRG